MRTLAVLSLCTMACCSASALGAAVTFASDPFAGSTALTTPGRQVASNNELFLPSFDIALDQFVVDNTFFNVGSIVSFGNDFASTLPESGLNVIVLRDTDNDNNPATAFNAGTAANLIAARVTTPGAGLFIYWNSSLNVNRLVYSTNLDDNTADLSVLARIVAPIGPDAIAELPRFTSANFGIIPAPSAAALVGIACVAASRRRRG